MHDNGTVNGGPLLIPATKVYDQLPLGLGPNDFTFTVQELAQFVQDFWQILVQRCACWVGWLGGGGRCVGCGGDRWRWVREELCFPDAAPVYGSGALFDRCCLAMGILILFVFLFFFFQVSLGGYHLKFFP